MSDEETYPRDMRGYGRETPDPKWPGGAKIAVQFVINYEEGGENNILHGDAASEAFLSEVVGAAAWPGQRHMNMESIYEFGSRAGFWRLWRAFTARNMPVTVYGVATALKRNPDAVAAMLEADWEIASHGLKWIEYKDFTREAEREHFREAIAIHTEATGERPLGWYTGRTSEHTTELVSEFGGFLYTADSYADELPYWIKTGSGPLLVVPYTLDANDMRFATPQGFNSGDQFEAYLRDSLDCLHAEGGRMMSVGLHCRLVGRPGRAEALRRFIRYAQAKGGVWFPQRIEIARHWAEHHPYVRHDRPSTMEHGAFVAAFGSIFEHSPWVADRAWHLELGPAHDTATGLHNALCRAFRSGTGKERLSVLTAHPDLAGKLAAARRLTPESTAEQASAGLDALTDEERATFTRLNDAYTARFGFPFIIAVRDNTKASILAAFERRLENDRDTEFHEACEQVARIGELRLMERLP